jgi:hypothetical protein
MSPGAHANNQIVFIGGLHKSGTSLTHRLLRAHPTVSGFANTGAPEDEGQHLQSVYLPAKAYGGPGRFAFDEHAHLTEHSDLASAASRVALFDDWARYWDLSKPVLIEKSPPNIIRARFLQSLFPGSKFIFVVRHPLAVAMATRKWSPQSDIELILHWLAAHDMLLDDLAKLENWAWLRYEDLIAKPDSMLSALCNFLGLAPIPLAEPVTSINLPELASVEPSGRSIRLFRAGSSSVAGRFGYLLAPPYYRPLPGGAGLVLRDGATPEKQRTNSDRADNADAIHSDGHRAFVGGLDSFWHRVSALQFDMLIEKGLRPNDVLLDLGCGSLRGGCKFIPYLDAGHYIGADKHIELIIYGVNRELGIDIFADKKPQFIITEAFDFSQLRARPTFAIAQSLFSHLTLTDISLCFAQLRRVVAPQCRFFATFIETAGASPNPTSSHSRRGFGYRREEIESVAKKHGWRPFYIGEWHHPRGQQLFEFRLA